ncbi:MAG: hypothetical protein WC657_07025 [Candidatus Paceibacterota bacterium]|jgi:hypothetical protein
MQTLTVPCGDKGFDLSFIAQDSTGAAKTLTGYTVTLKVWVAGNPGTLLVSGTLTVDSEALGTCHYAPTATDFVTIGEYYAELEYTQSGVIESSETFKIRVAESG